jgi:hypothetical protein
MSRPRYIPGPSTQGSTPTFIAGNAWQRPGVSPMLVIIATLVIITIIVLITLFAIRSMKRETVTLISGEDLLDLSKLIDLRANGLCCVPPSASASTQEWIYSAADDFTFSSTKTEPAVVCQGLIGVDLNNCLNYVSDADRNPLILAHYGVKPYYAFSPGTAGALCDSYAACE